MRTGRIEQKLGIDMSAPHAGTEIARQRRMIGGDMRRDMLIAAHWREIERAGQPAARQRELPREAARIGSELAGRLGAADVERIDANEGRYAGLGQDRAAPGEIAERRSTRRLHRETAVDRIEIELNRLKPQRIDRMIEQQADLGMIDQPVERELEGTVNCLRALPFELEAAVALAQSGAGDADRRRRAA